MDQTEQQKRQRLLDARNKIHGPAHARRQQQVASLPPHVYPVERSREALMRVTEVRSKIEEFQERMKAIPEDDHESRLALIMERKAYMDTVKEENKKIPAAPPKRTALVTPVEDTKEPGLLQKVGHAAKSIVQTSLGMHLASDEEIKRRMDICRGCDKAQMDAEGNPIRCGECGCSFKYKHRDTRERCPIHKWDQPPDSGKQLPPADHSK